jgi:hypothetical protein
MSDLTADELRRLLSYDPETGVFRWKVSRSNRVKVGAVAGTICSGGYCSVWIGRFYKSHRLAWLYVHGRWPDEMLDHVNGDPTDNRISNLREASRAENGMNRGRNRNNASGQKGVHWYAKLNKWCVSIKLEGKTRHLGYYSSLEDAANAYSEAARSRHGEFARTS